MTKELLSKGTLLLRREEVRSLLSIDECIAAVERAFRMYGEGRALPPGVLGIHTSDGGFHIKAGELPLDKRYFAVKVNGNFLQNRERFGMPAILGLIVLCDAENGYPLAVMDSIEITILRTGAATAVAARHLARPDSKVATICGCGNQGRIQLTALTRVLPITDVFAFDLDEKQADRYAGELSSELGIDIRSVRDLSDAIGQSDVVVTCTPSKKYFLQCDWFPSGVFVAAVGADSPEKQELEPLLLAKNTVVTDILDQCATLGELHHAIEQGLMTRESAYAELGEIIAGKKRARKSREEIIIFDSTGTALQDAAAAAIVYEEALRKSKGQWTNLLG